MITKQEARWLVAAIAVVLAAVVLLLQRPAPVISSESPGAQDLALAEQSLACVRGARPGVG